MSVIKPRNRLVYFRISEDEFQQVNSLCQAGRARSVSELARNAMQRMIGGTGGEDEAISMKLKALDDVIDELNKKLERLTTLLEGPAAYPGGEQRPEVAVTERANR